MVPYHPALLLLASCVAGVAATLEEGGEAGGRVLAASRLAAEERGAASCHKKQGKTKRPLR